MLVPTTRSGPHADAVQHLEHPDVRETLGATTESTSAVLAGRHVCASSDTQPIATMPRVAPSRRQTAHQPADRMFTLAQPSRARRPRPLLEEGRRDRARKSVGRLRLEIEK